MKTFKQWLEGWFDPPANDLRKNFDDKKESKDATLYRKGKILQVWWRRLGEGGSETWTFPTEENAISSFDDFDSREFEGQLGLVLGFEDEVSAAKLSHQFAKKNANLKILGGFFENEMIGLEKVTALAQIPSREELLAKFVGSISSPISGFANVLQGNIKGLIYALNAIKNK